MGIARSQASQVMTLTSKTLCILAVLCLMGQAAPITAHDLARVSSIAQKVPQNSVAPEQAFDSPVTGSGSLAPAGEKKPNWSIS